jgi:LPXTG-site transpeptidase (sortase) family protein
VTSPLRRAGLAALVLALAGCGWTAGTFGPPGTLAARDGTWSSAVAAPPVLPARAAPGQRVSFVPETLVLPGGASAAVDPTSTVSGVLQVPQDVSHVGWWDGSAEAGDPFGSTVIAGHLDSAQQGIGFFARLLRIKAGDTVTVRGAGHEDRYRVASVRVVAKRALARDGAALDQTGPHRLVLITCAGAFQPEQGGYASNLVVVAKPLGAAG